MIRMRLGRLAGASVVIACLVSPALAREPMTLRDYMALNGPNPTEHVAYGPAPLQYIEFFKPGGTGPYPVVVLIHGGCFTNAYRGMPQMRGMAAALAAKGAAVWSIEYRGVDSPGGGYPGTYLDIRAALDLLADQADARHLDTHRLVAVGHSAGAALVLWSAGRERLPRWSPLYEPHPLPIRKVIALGATGDFRPGAANFKANCGYELSQLVGLPTRVRPNVFSDTTAIDLTPNGSETVLIDGDHDTIDTPKESADYGARIRARGDVASTLVLPGASHYDEVAVTSPAWSLVEPAILNAIGLDSVR